MSRYIDVTNLSKQIADFKKAVTSPNSDYMTGYLCALSVTEGIIAETPTADVVEVVRCKDCQHWKDTSCDTVTETHWGECRKPLGDYGYCETNENDYCSYGERSDK